MTVKLTRDDKAITIEGSVQLTNVISLNNCFNSIVVKGRALRVPAKAYNHMKKDVRKQFFLTEPWITDEEAGLITEISAEWAFLLLPTKLYKKDGGISRISGDLSNFLKPMEDIVFASIHPKIDDSLVTGIVLSKQADNEIAPAVEFKLIMKKRTPPSK